MAKPLSPPTDLNDRIKFVTWPKGQVIHRIHPEKYGSAEFNPASIGNARFSPIRNIDSDIIPTIYGGSAFECTAMETVFHDIPHALGLKTLQKSKISELASSEIFSDRDLQLIDLRSIALRKFGLQRRDIIDTPVSEYPYTRSWAEAFHAQCKDAQGLYWQSKQADHAQAVVLFGDRVTPGSLKPLKNAVSILSTPTYSTILKLADAIEVQIV